MNPMIAFGWAVQSGAYKVWACDSSCAAFCGSDDFSTVFMHVTLPPYSFRSYLYVCMVTHILRKFCLLFFSLHSEFRPLPGLLDCPDRGRRFGHGTVRRLPSVLPGRRGEEEQKRLKMNRIQR